MAIGPRNRRPAPASGIVEATLPRRSPFLLRWFRWYSARFLRAHFNALRVSRSNRPTTVPGTPLVLYANHASWWDPLVAIVLQTHYFPAHRLFAPIDARMLEKYRFFGRLGFFGVEPETARGARQFLRTSARILAEPDGLLAVTPQGRFADVRERPLRLEPGLGHLARRSPGVCFQPVAIEFVFWEERLPEILVHFGEPIIPSHAEVSSSDAALWTARLEAGLAKAQDNLAQESLDRDPHAFERVLDGRRGTGGVYDWWRAAVHRLRGQSFNPAHSDR